MNTEIHAAALTVPILTNGEAARLARIDPDELAQWQRPNRRVLGEHFGEMSVGGRRLYSLNDAVFLRIVGSLIGAIRVQPADAAATADGLAQKLLALDARPLPAVPGECLVARLFHDGESWRWHPTTRAWIGREIAQGASADPEMVLPIEEMRAAVIRGALIHALAEVEIDPIAPRGTPSLASRLHRAGIRNAELDLKIAREKAAKR